MRYMAILLSIAFTFALGGAIHADDAKDAKPDKGAEKKAEEKDTPETPWTEEELKAFLKVGVKVTYDRKEKSPNHRGQDTLTPTIQVTESGDKGITVKTQMYLLESVGNRMIWEPMDRTYDFTWEQTKTGAFDYMIVLDEHTKVSSEKLKVGNKTYKCTVYTREPKKDYGKEKWWVADELPGLVLKYEDRGTAMVNGAKVTDHLMTSFEATAVEIPKDAVQPDKKKKK